MRSEKNPTRNFEYPFLQKNGCVFLPAAGFHHGRNGDTDIHDAGDYGYYWSASPHGSARAFNLRFGSSDVDPAISSNRWYEAYAVRLVTDVN